MTWEELMLSGLFLILKLSFLVKFFSFTSSLHSLPLVRPFDAVFFSNLALVTKMKESVELFTFSSCYSQFSFIICNGPLTCLPFRSSNGEYPVDSCGDSICKQNPCDMFIPVIRFLLRIAF